MTLPIIITACILVLIAYFFDLIAFRVKIPSVIMLLGLGLICNQLAIALHIRVPDLNVLLPVFGTVGLVLIVLEGSLELEVRKNKIHTIKKALLVAVLPMFILAFIIAFAFYWAGVGTYKNCLSNAIPLSIISSAVAIPSVKKLAAQQKEFTVYESSISDIAGVVFFNFVALNREIDFDSITKFSGQLVLIFLITVAATIGISILINKLQHHVKYTPILVTILLVYAICKTIHLPALIFVLSAGLFLGNIIPMKENKWIKKLHPLLLAKNVAHFKEITVEATFLVRILFFILFGFLINPADISNFETLPWAFGIAAGIYIIRLIFLKLTKMPVLPLLCIAPRGLITILLFYNIVPEDRIGVVNTSLIIQVVLITAIAMMVGLIMTKEKAPAKEVVVSHS
jgi:hypothetical protein